MMLRWSRQGAGRSRHRVGARVRIRSAEQIAATLDAEGRLDGLPFMPEMLPYCGQVLVVRRSAHKTCDSINMSGLRSMGATVHLEGLHCDGAAHGGCQSRCPLFFKDAWLERADAGGHEHAAGSGSGDRDLAAKADRSVRLHGRDPARGTYSCQGTEILEATRPLPFWRLATRTPDVRIGIEAGETVVIHSHAEILETLDRKGHNRGLAFDVEMVPYCGHRATVRHRVETRIDERTGELVELRNPCLVLDGVVCQGRYHRFCPRALDAYWREAWLARAPRTPRRDA